MAIDVDAITKQVVEAMRASVGDLPKEELAAVEAQAKALAAALARIGEARLAGQINDEQAKAFLKAESEAVQAGLIAKAGLASQRAGTTLQAGLKALISAALNAVGLDWAGPAIEKLLAQLEASATG